jgi:virginiamycin B lyase
VSRALTVALDGGPYALAAGPDRAMWVTLAHSGEVARVSESSDTGAACDVTVFPVAADARPAIITAGPDDAMWFTRTGDDRIGRITMSGERTEFELPSGSAPFGITGGPDGALWFTASGSGGAGIVGRVSIDGEISVEEIVHGSPSMIVTGPDNALWFTLNEASAVARLEPGGDVTIRALPTPAAGPVGIAATHDDTVWFTEIVAEKVGRILAGDAIQELDLPGKPHAVVADASGGVWVSLWGSDQIAKIEQDGEVTTFDLPAGSEPHGMAVGPDGAIWVALESGFVLRLPF